MATDWNAEAAEVTATLADEGQPVTLRVVTAGEYEPGAGVTQTTADYPASAVLFDYNLQQAGAQFADGGMILLGDKQAYLSVPAIAPQPGHLLIDVTGQTWHVVNVKSVAPAGAPVLYELHVRKP